MVHWPKSIVGSVVTIAIIFIAGLALVQSAIALSGTFIWISLAVATLVVFVAVVAYRRAQAASDLALADAPSFRCSPRSSEDETQNSGPVSVNRTASPAATKNPHSASEAPSSATFR